MIGLTALIVAVATVTVQAVQRGPVSSMRHHVVQASAKVDTVKAHSHKLAQKLKDGWTYITLDEAESASRGSYCIDGSTPGFFYKSGTSDHKWLIGIEGGMMFCYDDATCVSMFTGDYTDADTMVYMTLFESSEFSDFHQVELHHCDGGMFMGDRSEPMVIQGHTMYFRGKRIVDHVFETLQKNTTFSSATEVLITGGSGGGQTSFLLADYFASLMPASVQKIGAVPMSGWYTANDGDIEAAFLLHEMSSAVAPGCAAAFSQNEQYKCLHPNNSYAYSTTPMFVVQMLDSQSISSYYEHTTEEEPAKEAWTNCLLDGTASASACDSASATLLQDYLDSFVSEVQSIPKSTQEREGGFLSTCTKHVFYKEEEYSHYAINGVTVEDAVADWWRNLGTAQAKWYLPCELNTQGMPCQCESSCAFDSGSTD